MASGLIIVGGSSGMGFGAAKVCVESGGKVLLASRSEEKLCRAADRLKETLRTIRPEADPAERIQTKTLDFHDENAVKQFFEEVPNDVYDGLIVSAMGRACHGSFLELETSKVKDLFMGKFWGPYFCAKYGAPKLADNGAIVFVSGVLNRRPGQNCSSLASGNGAIEALTRSLALELGPRLRVNCLSPGFTDTERFDHMDPQKKEAMIEATAYSLPLKRVGTSEQIGEALVFLAKNQFTTGVVLDVDGGHQIRQYAYPNDVYQTFFKNK